MVAWVVKSSPESEVAVFKNLLTLPVSFIQELTALAICLSLGPMAAIPPAAMLAEASLAAAAALGVALVAPPAALEEDAAALLLLAFAELAAGTARTYAGRREKRTMAEVVSCIMATLVSKNYKSITVGMIVIVKCTLQRRAWIEKKIMLKCRKRVFVKGPACPKSSLGMVFLYQQRQPSRSRNLGEYAKQSWCRACHTPDHDSKHRPRLGIGREVRADLFFCRQLGCCLPVLASAWCCLG
jgi:hypothetical protein